MTKVSAQKTTTQQALDHHKETTFAQILAFDANTFQENWEQSASFLKALRYERLQLQQRILNQVNESGQSVLEQGLMSEAPETIKSLIITIIRSFSEDQQIQFLRAFLIKHPEQKEYITIQYPELDIGQKRVQPPEQLMLDNASIRGFFNELPKILDGTLSNDKSQTWIKSYYQDKTRNILVDVLKTNNFELLKEVINITAILNKTLLLDYEDVVLSNMMGFTAKQKNSIKQTVIDIGFIEQNTLTGSLNDSFINNYFNLSNKTLNQLDYTLLLLSSYKGYHYISTTSLFRSDLKPDLWPLHEGIVTLSKDKDALSHYYKNLIQIQFEFYQSKPNAEQDRLLNDLWHQNINLLKEKSSRQLTIKLFSLENSGLTRNGKLADRLHTLDESRHLLGLLQEIKSPPHSNTLKERAQLAIDLVQRQLWHQAIDYAQHDPLVITYLLTLIAALARPVEPSRQPIVSESSVLALLNDLSESFQTYPDQIEAFLIKETPPAEVAMALLFLLPIDKRDDILNKNVPLYQTLMQHTTDDWYAKQTDFNFILNTLILLNKMPDSVLNNRIINELADSDTTVSWHDSLNLSRLTLNTLEKMVQWHNQPGLPETVSNAFFSEQEVISTLQSKIIQSLQDEQAIVRNQGIGLFFQLPHQVRSSLLNLDSSITSLLAQALPTTEPELGNIINQSIQNHSEDEFITVLNACDEDKQMAYETLVNSSGETVRFRLQQSIVQQEGKNLAHLETRLKPLHIGAISDEAREHWMLCAAILGDNGKSIASDFVSQLQTTDLLERLLVKQSAHHIRTVLLALLSLGEQLPPNYMSQHVESFQPIIGDVVLFLKSITPAQFDSKKSILDLLCILSAEQQQEVFSANPELKKYVDVMLDDNWYQQQASNGSMDVFFKAWFLQKNRDWPVVKFNTDTLIAFLTKLSTLQPEKRLSLLCQKISHADSKNIWSHIREQILKNSDELIQQNALVRLLPILIQLTDAERREVLLYRPSALKTEDNRSLGECFFQLAAEQNIPKIQAWKKDYDDHQVIHQQLEELKNWINGWKEPLELQWMNVLFSKEYNPPCGISKEQVEKGLRTNPQTLVAVFRNGAPQLITLLLTLINEMPEDIQYALLMAEDHNPRRALDWAVQNLFYRDSDHTLMQFHQLMQMIKKLSSNDRSLLFSHADQKNLTVLQYALRKSEALQEILSNIPKESLDGCLQQYDLYHYKNAFSFNQLLQAIYDNPHVSAKKIALLIQPFQSSSIFSFPLCQGVTLVQLIDVLKRLPSEQLIKIFFDQEALYYTDLSENAEAQGVLLDWMAKLNLEQQASLFKEFQCKRHALPNAGKMTIAFHQNPVVRIQYHMLQLAHQSQMFLEKPSLIKKQQDYVTVLTLYQSLKEHQLTLSSNDVTQQQKARSALITATQTALIKAQDPMLRKTIESIQDALLEQQFKLIQNNNNSTAWAALKDKLTERQKDMFWTEAFASLPTDPDSQVTATIIHDFVSVFLKCRDDPEILQCLSSIFKTWRKPHQEEVLKHAQSTISRDYYQDFYKILTFDNTPYIQDVSLHDLMVLFPDSINPTPEAIESNSSASQQSTEALQQDIQKRLKILSANNQDFGWLLDATITFFNDNQPNTTNEGWNIISVAALKDPELLRLLLSYIQHMNPDGSILKKWLLDETQHGTVLKMAAWHQFSSFDLLFHAMTSLDSETQAQLFTPIFENFSTLPQEIKFYLSNKPQVHTILDAYADLRHKAIDLGNLASYSKERLEQHYHTWNDHIKQGGRNESASQVEEARQSLSYFLYDFLQTVDWEPTRIDWIKTLHPKAISGLILNDAVRSEAMSTFISNQGALEKQSPGFITKGIDTLFSLVNTVAAKDRNTLILAMSHDFFTMSHRYGTNAQVTVPWVQQLFQTIKQLPPENQATFFEKMHRHPAMRYFSKLSPQAKRDFHLIELATKVHEFQNKIVQTKDPKKQAQYRQAYEITRDLHNTLFNSSMQQDRDPVTNRESQSAEWFNAINTARKQLESVEKNLFQMKNLFQRLWKSMERMLGLTSVTGQHLLTELNRYRLLPSTVVTTAQKVQPSAPSMLMEENNIPDDPTERGNWISNYCIKTTSASELFSKKTSGRLNILQFIARNNLPLPEDLPFLIHQLSPSDRQLVMLDLDMAALLKRIPMLEQTRQHLYVLSLEQQLINAHAHSTLTQPAYDHLMTLHNALFEELKRHENHSTTMQEEEIKRHQATWNLLVDEGYAQLKKDYSQSSWLPWVFPSKHSQVIHSYKAFIKEMKVSVEQSNTSTVKRQ